jgi:hypothetical protein
MYAKRGSRKVLVILNARQIQPSEPPAHPVENLGVAEVIVPEPLVAEVMRGVSTIEPRGPNWGAQVGDAAAASAQSAGSAPSDAGQTGGGGPGARNPEGVVTSVKELNAFDVEVDVRGLTTTMQFVVNFFTEVHGVLQKGAFVEVQYQKQGGRNIVTDITVEPPPKHITR